MPRRASPPSGELPTQQRGRFKVSQIVHHGPDPLRLLLIADQHQLADADTTAREVIEKALDDLHAITTRGVSLDVVSDPTPVLKAFGATTFQGWRNWQFDLVLVDAAAAHGREAVNGIAELEAHSPVALVRSRAGTITHTSAVLPTIDLGDADAIRALVDGRTTAADIEGVEEIARSDSARRVVQSHPRTSRLQPVAVMTSRTYEMPHVMINLLTGNELVTIAAVGSEPGRQPQIDTLCHQTIAAEGLHVIPDTWQEPTLIGNPNIIGADPVRFYAAFPLRDDDGRRIGSMCVWDNHPHRLDDYEYASLRDLALLAEAELSPTP